MLRKFEIVKKGLVVVIGVTLGIAYFYGVYHSFAKHGPIDGFFAVVIPPYGVYRGAESIWHDYYDASSKSSQ